MKKILKALSIIIIVYIIICRIIASTYDYDIGRDTHKSFGNREYQILNTCMPNGKKEKILYNEKYEVTIINNLYEYQEKWKYVYFYGVDNSNVNIYVRLDKYTNQILYYIESGECSIIKANDMVINNALILVDTIDSFSDKDISILNKLNYNYGKSI